MTKQWDKYREVIIAEYKSLNKPLREVQHVMAQRYGFRASTRAYRSRFDRWGVHKYSRRKRSRSMSLCRRESESDGDMHPSPGETQDMEASDSQGTSPVMAAPSELSTQVASMSASSVVSRSSLSLRKTDFPYAPATPPPNASIAHDSAFYLSHFGSGFPPYSSQNMACYSSSSLPTHRQHVRDVVSHSASESEHGSLPSMSGFHAGYGYSLAFLTGHE